MGSKVKVTFQGKEYNAEKVDFETVREDWSKYKLDDGATLKMRTIVSGVVRLPLLGEDGNPIYMVKSSNIVEADVPDHLRPKKSKEAN